MSLQATTAERDQAQAAARIINEERQLMKTEWTEMFSSYDGLRNEIQSLREQLAATQSSLQVRLACFQFMRLVGWHSGWSFRCAHPDLLDHVHESCHVTVMGKEVVILRRRS
jgi:hypothetical protein